MAPRPGMEDGAPRMGVGGVCVEAERERGWPTVVVVVVMRQRAVAPAGRTGAGTLHRPPPKGTVAVGQVPFACGCSVHSPRGGGGRTGGGDGTPKAPCARPQQRTGHCTTPCAATGQQPEEAWRVARPVNAHSDHPVTAQ